MALTYEGSGNGFYMPVAPAYGYGGNGGGFGFGGGDWAWILLLLLIGGNGWGFGGGFGGGMMWPMMMGCGMNGFGLDYLYPWLNNSQHMSDGFRDQALQTSINGLQNSVTAGFGDVQLGIAAAAHQLAVDHLHNAAGKRAAVWQLRAHVGMVNPPGKDKGRRPAGKILHDQIIHGLPPWWIGWLAPPPSWCHFLRRLSR